MNEEPEANPTSLSAGTDGPTRPYVRSAPWLMFLS